MMMKKFICLLLAALPLGLFAQNTAVRINEVDPDQPGTDTFEFIELYGPANASLDGLVLVLFTGAPTDNNSYSVVDLSGHSLNGQGFFLLGSQLLLDSLGITGIVLPGNIQNGADGIALYAGNASIWPSGTAVTAVNLIDAIVYGTNDPDATGLISVLVPGQAQLNDSGTGTTSFSRFPDGGPALNHASFVVQAPTPGATNGVPPACLSGILSSSSPNNLCIETLPDTISASMTGATGNVIYALTSAGTVLDTSTAGNFIIDSLTLTDFQIWGIAYTDSLVLSPGMLVDSIDAACISLSSPLNFIVQDCLPNCTSGVLSSTSLDSIYVLGDAVSVDLSLTGSGAQIFFLTDTDSTILFSSSDSVFILDSLQIGSYQLWGGNYDGDLSGDTLNGHLSAITANCWGLSNSLTFSIIDSSTCALTSFQLSDYSLCQQTDSMLIVSASGATGGVRYFITNLEDSVLLTTLDTFELNLLDTGIYRVHALAYTTDDTTHYELWDTIPNLADDGCPKLYGPLTFSYVYCPCSVSNFTASASTICIEDTPVEVTFNADVYGEVLYGLALNSVIKDVNSQMIAIINNPPGEYQLFAIAYFGDAPDSGLIGNSLDNISFDSCFTISGLLPLSIQDCIPNCYVDGMSVVGQLNQCEQIDYAPLVFAPDSLVGNLMVYRTDSMGMIIDTLTSASFDAGFFAPGSYYFQAIAYSGSLIDTTIQAGDAVSAIQSNDCVSFFDTTFTLTISACELTAPCTELFFSEYLEGSSNNKAIEIYNPTPFAVDLAAYKVELYNNGFDSSASYTLVLTGLLESGDVYVIAHVQASPGILAIADTTSYVANFNGDDAIVLVHDGTPVDIIGIVGEDPGGNWSVGGGATNENTLVRNPDFTSATTDWVLLQTQWIVYPQDDTTHLGSHETVGCVVGPDPCIVSFTSTTTDSSVTLQINANEPNQTFLIQWGDGATGDQNTLTHTYAASGYYEVCISASDTTCDYQFCGFVGIGIECAIDVVITENDPIVSVLATELATGSGIFEVSWGIGTPSLGANVSNEYTASGNYQVCVTYTDTVLPQCVVEECALVSVVVPSTCIAELVVLPGINPGEYQVIVDGSGAMDTAYYINWGDGTEDSTMTASHIYGPGTFDITATYGDANVGGCFVELGPETVVIEANCFAFMEIISAGSVVNVTPSTIGFGVPNYNINWGDGVIDSVFINNQSSVWHDYAAPGTYTITLSAIDNDPTGCAVDITETITIVQPGGSCSVQLETSLDLSAITAVATGPTDGTYIISWGDGNYSIGESAQYSYEYPDTFSVCVQYTSLDGQCSSSDCNDVIFTDIASCQLEILGITTQSLAATMELSVTNSANTIYIINWGDDVVDSTYNDFHVYNAPGTYVVTVTIFDAQDPLCFAIDQFNVTVQETASDCDVTLTITPQQDGSVLAEAQGTGAVNPTYSITWGDGSVPELSDSASHTYAMSGNYQICVTYADLGDLGCFATQCEFVSGTEEIKNTQFGAAIFPNPLVGNSVLQINSKMSGPLMVDIYDAMGRMAASVYNGDITPGQSRFSLPTESLLPGLYSVVVRSEMGASSITVVKN